MERTARWRYRLSDQGPVLPQTIRGIKATPDAVYISGTGAHVSGVIAALSSKEGTLQWVTPVGALCPTVAALMGTRLYTADWHHSAFALETKKGRMVWRHPIGSGLRTAQQLSLLVDHEHCYTRVWEEEPLHPGKQEGDRGSRQQQEMIVALSTQTGKEEWRYYNPNRGLIFDLDWQHGHLLVAPPQGGLIALDTRSGKVVRKLPPLRQHRFLGQPPFALRCDEKRLLWLEPSGIRCLTLTDLKTIWERKLALLDHNLWRTWNEKGLSKTTGYPFQIREGNLYCISLKENKLYALQLETGAIQWSLSLENGLDPSLFVVTSQWVIYGSEGSHGTVDLHWLRRADGQLVSHLRGVPARTSGASVAPKILDGNDSGVYIGTRESVLAFSHPVSTP